MKHPTSCIIWPLQGIHSISHLFSSFAKSKRIESIDSIPLSSEIVKLKRCVLPGRR